MALALLVFVATLGSATFLKTDFLGSVTDQTTLAIQQKLPPGTRLSATSEAAEQVESLLRADPQVKSYLTTIGGSLVPGAPRNTNTAEFTVLLVEGARADALRPQLEQKVAELDSSAGEITVTMTNNEGTTNDLTITVSSENTTDLQTGAKRIEQELETIPGLGDITSNLEEQRKVLRVNVDKKKAASLGFTQGEVGQAVSSALRGTRVGSVTLEGEQRDIFVRSQEPTNRLPPTLATSSCRSANSSNRRRRTRLLTSWPTSSRLLPTSSSARPSRLPPIRRLNCASNARSSGTIAPTHSTN